MFVVNSYSLAVIFCFITMLCWGSWGNTQKLAGKTWRYELFYWDYVIGMVLFAILLGFTMGSIGTEGRPFLEDLAQAELCRVDAALPFFRHIHHAGTVQIVVAQLGRPAHIRQMHIVVHVFGKVGDSPDAEKLTLRGLQGGVQLCAFPGREYFQS